MAALPVRGWQCCGSSGGGGGRLLATPDLGTESAKVTISFGVTWPPWVAAAGPQEGEIDFPTLAMAKFLFCTEPCKL